MRRWAHTVVAVVATLALASLLSVLAYGRFAEAARGAPSHALPLAGDSTPLDHRITALGQGHEGKSGLLMLASNLDAFAARALSARAAGRSLDLMYYIWKRDLSGRLLMAELVAAADRGVRVRLLLDDIGAASDDPSLLALDAHPLIEVRLFNPTRARPGGLRRGAEMALRAFSMTRRMHNKAWIADGRIAIVGGRNIGDEYFDASEGTHFRDLDLLGLGPVADQAGPLFDGYWNSPAALPIVALSSAEAAPLQAMKAALRVLAQSKEARPYLDRLRDGVSLPSLLAQRLHWSAQARLLADPPQKVLGQEGDNWLMRELAPLMASAHEQLRITSPYFVPGEAGTAALLALAGRGVRVSVLTNSLAATDVAAVHGGYAPYRLPLLRGGVALHELRASAGSASYSLRGSSNASLHTKAFTVDRRIGFIGSLNFDPRSVSLNTEMGIAFEAPELIAEMDALFAKETSPRYSYKLRLDEQGRLRWITEDQGAPLVHEREPQAPLLNRAIARLVGWLPLESQL
jgi:putative cardiolipin synthase